MHMHSSTQRKHRYIQKGYRYIEGNETKPHKLSYHRFLLITIAILDYDLSDVIS